MRNIEDVVPSIFEKTAKKAGIKFVNEAKDKTDEEGLVDTGAYKRSWHADIGEIKQKFWVVRCINSMDYASDLELGYEIKTAHFVPFEKMEGTKKTKALIASFKAKNPKAKGFIAKPRRFKGRFIGRYALDKAREYAHEELENELGSLYKKD